MSSRKHLSVEILQNSEVVKVGLTKNYRFRKNGVTHKLTLTPKRGFDKTYEGNWTCRVQFLDDEKNLKTHEKSILLLREKDPTTEPIKTCKQSCNNDYCHKNGQCCIDEFTKIEKCYCDQGFYGARCSKLSDANIPIVISLSFFVLFGIALLIWKTCKSQSSPPATSNNDPRSNRTDETST